jgi:cytochrome P450
MTTLPRGGGKDRNAPLFVPKDTHVGYAIFGIHRSIEYWGVDVHEFRPERWSSENKRPDRWSYLPFNEGPRKCLGGILGPKALDYFVKRES